MELLDSKFSISLLKVNKSFLSEDGTRKWLFKLKDGKDIKKQYLFLKEKEEQFVFLLKLDVPCPAPFVTQEL